MKESMLPGKLCARHGHVGILRRMNQVKMNIINIEFNYVRSITIIIISWQLSDDTRNRVGQLILERFECIVIGSLASVQLHLVYCIVSRSRVNWWVRENIYKHILYRSIEWEDGCGL